MELLKLLSTNELIAQTVSFLLLLFLLRVFAWKRLLGLLDERRGKISADFQKIEETRRETEKIKQQYETKWNEIETQARARIQEAVVEGQKAAEGIRKDAQLGAQEILEKAKAEMRYEVAKAREDLKGEIIDLVLKTTEYVVEEKLTPEGDKKIVENFLDKLDKMP